ncbi:CoA transferase [Rhodoferax sp. TH121]|uniref:CoA transferase n=1 Tax=Rhodoferax sp. TH121 TaxID=2022803 RepID=UPI000B967A4B|nr:CoA transferase [Rhodoferax sp. TH121]OYQ41352.1 CoA transferase [Rhodoferax sp. TH121]
MNTKPPIAATKTSALRPLKGVRILSLALNLPGPAALMRCRDMGASCTKLEPPPHPSAPKGTSGDPMGLYNRAAYDVMHAGMKVSHADLKTEAGQKALHRALAKTDVLLTSFRPSALKKLGLEWKALHKQYPQLSLVAIVGAPGARAEEPGHDLTYLAENDLVTGLDLPPTLYADMAGSLMASEAVLQARLLQLQKGKGVVQEVALSAAAGYLALPRTWGLTAPGAAVGGGHAGYRVYPCQDGRVALAALEPHFAAALAAEVGLRQSHILAMFAPETHTAIAAYLAGKTRQQLDALATAKDIPLYTMN